MRFFRPASATAAVVLVLALPYEAVSHPRGHSGTGPAHSGELFGAECRVRVDGSRVTAYCHNPYPDIDRVSLHVECVHWWDLDSDGTPVEAGPAQTVRLTGRCWSEVGSAWVGHLRTD
ncbi:MULTISPECIES: hypothetical protein [Streptomyces]|uniref:Uncharacterized protein n=2 Tax=Streptomyces TaxID=1883 RepID=A0AA40VKS9_9ACTN|nr:hypothetical protein [Streptomyces calvus]MBA8947419.1 hypothetical protein [Streptomyces calvus]MBA8979236.1 hypothetical protein [Streptomyces calvus]MYS31074.1 hypothetical protein [Streptomyces sp. SID7804]GGP71746.1 hypothetical protein GCM10010247_51220 [Streptomyces calvus]